MLGDYADPVGDMEDAASLRLIMEMASPGRPLQVAPRVPEPLLADPWPQPRGLALYVASLVEPLVLQVVIPEMERISGHKSTTSGYDAFVEQARIIRETSDVEGQRAFGSLLLRRVIPVIVTWPIRALFTLLSLVWPDGHAAFVRHSVGFFGPVFSYWLVGECRMMTPEEEAAERWERDFAISANGPHPDTAGPHGTGPVFLIRKCKFMEATGGCKGLCLNLCKVAAEEYLSKELGLKVYMDPDMSDYSCRMRFLQEPLPPDQDPAFSRTCGSSTCDRGFVMPASPAAETAPGVAAAPVA